MAIQTIYRELDRARALIKKHAKRDDDTEDFEEDWTLVEDDEEVDITRPFEIREPVAGMSQAFTGSPRMGGASLALGSIALKGANAPKESAYRSD